MSLAAESRDGSVWLWSGSHPANLNQLLTGSAIWIESVAFSQDGQTLAAGTSAGDVWLWNSTHPDRPTQIAQPPPDLMNGTDYSLAFSPDGHTLAAGGTNDGVIWLWNTINPDRPTELGHLPRQSVAFSPDGHPRRRQRRTPARSGCGPPPAQAAPSNSASH